MVFAASPISDAAAELGSRADKRAEFELEIEMLRWREARRAVRFLALPLRPFHRDAADTHRGGAAVISKRHM